MTKGSIKVTEKCPLCGSKTVKIVYHTEAGIVILSEYNCSICGSYTRMNFLVADPKEG
jgi:rRNA maturation protein Nop10